MINLQTKLSHWMERKPKKGELVGIELEYEKFNARQVYYDEVLPKYWSMDNDPSLRDGGIELISRPLTPHKAKFALKEAKAIMAEYGGTATIRCGLHIHLNMGDLLVKDLWNLLTLYTLLEPTIFKQYADGREDSHFCVPMYSNAVFADGLYRDIQTLRVGIQEESKLRKARPVMAAYEAMIEDAVVAVPKPKRGPSGYLNVMHGIKYSALNCRTLPPLGTLEFRQHPATEDMKEVQEWIDVLLRLRRCAIEYKDPLDVIEEYERDGLFGLRVKMELDHVDVDDLDQEEAEDVATMMAGYIPQPWQELNWEIN